MTEEKASSRELRVALEEARFEKLREIKRFHGFRNTAELVRFLITKEFRRIRNPE